MQMFCNIYANTVITSHMFLKYGKCTWRTDFFVNLNINRYMWLVATIFDAACLEGTIGSSGHIPLIHHLVPCCEEGWNWRSRWDSVKLEETCLSCPRLKVILHNSSYLTLKRKILNVPFTLTSSTPPIFLQISLFLTLKISVVLYFPKVWKEIILILCPYSH